MSDDDTRHSGSRWEPTPASVPEKNVTWRRTSPADHRRRETTRTTARRPRVDGPGPAADGEAGTDRMVLPARTTRPTLAGRAAGGSPGRLGSARAAPPQPPPRRAARRCGGRAARGGRGGGYAIGTPQPGATRPAPPNSQGRRASTATTAARSVPTAASGPTGTATARSVMARSATARPAGSAAPLRTERGSTGTGSGTHRDWPWHHRDVDVTTLLAMPTAPPARRSTPAPRAPTPRSGASAPPRSAPVWRSSRTGGSPGAASVTSRAGRTPSSRSAG